MSKKIVFRYILSIVFLMLLALSFSACNNMSGVSRPNNNKGNVYLKVNVASVGRTALPDFPDVDSISDFTFTLTGKGPGDSELTPLATETNSTGKYASLSALQSASFPIQTGEWTFKLTASKEGTTLSDEISETITSGSNTLSFNLKWEDTNLDETKTGSLSFELDFSAVPNKEDVKLVTAELVNTVTNDTTCSSTVILDRSSSPSTYKATYSSSTLPALANLSAGTYRIILKLFTVDSSANSNVLINTWTELAIITGGQTSTGSSTMNSLNEVYTINWNLDGGSSSVTLPECYTRLSSDYDLPDATSMSKTAYIFDGWYDSDDFDTANPVSSLDSGSTGIKGFYAKWIPTYATVAGVDYPDKASTLEAIAAATGEMSVVLYGIVPPSDFLSSGTNNRIMCAIKNSPATSVSISVASGQTIALSGNLTNCISECSNIVSIDMTGFDTSGVTGMKQLFKNNTNLETIILPETFVTTSVTDMSEMFAGCSSLETLDCSKFNTSSVTTMSQMFKDCSSLTTLNVSSFDTTHLNSIYSMFEGCSSLTTVNVSSFVIPSGVSLNAMFKNCSSLTSINVNSFAPENPTTIAQMFYGCSALTSLDLTSFQTASTSTMEGLFSGCTNLETITVSDKFKLYQYVSANDMFTDCTKLTGVRGTTYNASNPTNKTYARVDGGAGAPGYFTPLHYAKVGATQCDDVDEIAAAITSATSDIDIVIFGDGTYTAENQSTINGALRTLYTNKPEVKVTIDMSYLGELSSLENVATSMTSAESTQKSFSGCENLAGITLPAGLTSIGKFAFYKCTSLPSITIPASVTTIDEYAFSNCSGLTQFEIPTGISSLSSYLFNGCTGLTEITITSNIASIGSYTFVNCSNLEDVYFCNDDECTLFSIGSYAFKACTALGGIWLRSSVKILGEGAFYGCSTLNTIDLKSVETIGESCFANCGSLSSITIPDSVTTFGAKPFAGTGITTFYFPSGMTTIPDSILEDCTTLTSVSWPDNVQTIGSKAFYKCTCLTSITIPDTVTTINSEAFAYSKISSVTIPESVTTMGNSVFYNCTSLTQVEFDGTCQLTSIPNKTFSSCNKLETIQIPDSIQTIGNEAFYGCAKLASINFSNNLTSIGEYAFASTILSSVTIPSSVTSIGQFIFESCAYLETVVFDGTCQITEIPIKAFSGTKISSITIPSSVTTLGVNVFENCPWLETVEFEGTCHITTIPDNAFAGCSSLANFEIPSSVTTIGKKAFYACASLGPIQFPYSVTIIGIQAFKDCENITAIDLCCVEIICQYAFEGCGITSVLIPETVKRIDESPFPMGLSTAAFELTEGWQKTDTGGTTDIDVSTEYTEQNAQLLKQSSHILFRNDN